MKTTAIKDKQQEEKKGEILKLLGNLEITRQEIEEITGFTEDEVVRYIGLLCNEGLITQTPHSHSKGGSFEVRYHAI